MLNDMEIGMSNKLTEVLCQSMVEDLANKILTLNARVHIIRGLSGSGKTSILKKIKEIVGVNAVYIDAKCYILNASIKENIQIGRGLEVDLDKLISSAFDGEERFCEDSLVNRNNLSAGQVQRISLLRDIIDTQNKILLLDEPTSALDKTTEALMIKIISESLDLFHIRKLIVVTHSTQFEEIIPGAMIEYIHS